MREEPRLGWETEHLDDPPDKADAYALLDNGMIRAGYCPSCAHWICSCDEPVPDSWKRRYPRTTRSDR